MRFILKGNPVTKKNSQKIIRNRYTGKPKIIQSDRYLQYERDCKFFIPKIETIDYPINLKVVYFRKTKHRVDLNNLLSATTDILVKYGVLKDDCVDIVQSFDGSRVYYDKENSRAEIEIKRVS